MRLIQLIGITGDNVALFKTDRTDKKVEQDIKDAYHAAKDMEDQGDEIYVPDEAEAILEKKGITRVYVDDVHTEVL